MAFPIVSPATQFFDDNGDVLSGGLIYVYEAGTLTPANSYPTSADADAGTNANTNPVELNAAGRAQLWGEDAESYKIIIKTAAGVTVQTIDTIGGQTSDNVTFLPSGAGATTRTVQDKLRDVFSIKDVGATGSGSDDSTALSTASADADGRRIYIPAGTYKIDTDITLSDDEVIIEGEGPASVLDMSGGGSLTIASTVTALPDLASNISAGDNDVVFASAHGLSVGDVFAVWNPTDSSFSAYRTYYRDGCMFRVAEVVSTTAVKVFGVSPDAYASADMECYSIDGGRVTLRNFRVIPPATGTPVVNIVAHQNVTLDQIEMAEGAANTCFQVYRCFDVVVHDVKSDVFSGDAYPVAIANSQKVRVDSGSLYSDRHSVAIGGGSDAASVPPRDIRIVGCSLYNNATGGLGASDIHGGSENIEYVNCYMNAMANIGGKNVRYFGCRIEGRSPTDNSDGCCMFGSEVVGGTYEIENCHFITYGDGTAFGTIYIVAEDIEEDLHVLMRNNTIENRGASPGTARLVMVHGGNTTPPTSGIHIEIDGLHVKAADAFCVLFISGSNDISGVLSAIIDNVYGPDGMPLMGASNAANYGTTVPLRLMRQSGSVDASCGSGGTSAVAAAQTFRYPYPRIPIAHVSLGSTDGLAKQTFGGRNLTPLVRSLSASQIGPAALTSAETTFTSTENVRLHWSAEIREV